MKIWSQKRKVHAIFKRKNQTREAVTSLVLNFATCVQPFWSLTSKFDSLPFAWMNASNYISVLMWMMSLVLLSFIQNEKAATLTIKIMKLDIVDKRTKN